MSLALFYRSSTAGYVADLSAPGFAFTSQTPSWFNDYLAQLTAAVFAVTAQPPDWLQDTIFFVSAASMAISGQSVEWIFDEGHIGKWNRYQVWVIAGQPANILPRERSL